MGFLGFQVFTIKYEIKDITHACMGPCAISTTTICMY